MTAFLPKNEKEIKQETGVADNTHTRQVAQSASGRVTDICTSDVNRMDVCQMYVT